MTERRDRDDAWFAPTRYGYGTGIPIAPQGWFALLIYIGVVLLGGLLAEWDAEIGAPAGFAIILAATIIFLAIAARKTRGGWRWRWGEDD